MIQRVSVIVHVASESVIMLLDDRSRWLIDNVWINESSSLLLENLLPLIYLYCFPEKRIMFKYTVSLWDGDCGIAISEVNRLFPVFQFFGNFLDTRTSGLRPLPGICPTFRISKYVSFFSRMTRAYLRCKATQTTKDIPNFELSSFGNSINNSTVQFVRSSYGPRRGERQHLGRCRGI